MIDANWRWSDVDGTNCYKGTLWNATLCPDPETCASACSLEGADYAATYGVTTSGGAVRLNFSTYDSRANTTSIGSRLYVLGDDSTYEVFKLKNMELSFEVDVSTLGCGLNGALYFVEMSEDGNVGVGSNKAGAGLGTGYCDAQCPHDIKFIDGEANLLDWTPKVNSTNSGNGRYGTCCIEVDVWEANARAHQSTPHACLVQGQYRCLNSTDCGDDATAERNAGVCDKNGCDFNPSRLGVDAFYGNGSEFAVDSSRKFTVVTQFLTADNTSTSDLVEIRRFFVQDGAVVANVAVEFAGRRYDSITDDYCAAKTDAFAASGDVASFAQRGGLKAVGDSMDRGHVLVLSLWDDYDVDMIWLDAQDPPGDAYRNVSGAYRGPCPDGSGKPWIVEETMKDAYVEFFDVKIGSIGFTLASLDNDDDEDDDVVLHCQDDNDCAGNLLDTTCVVANDGSWTQCVSCNRHQFQYECPYWSGSFKSTAEAVCGFTCAATTA